MRSRNAGTIRKERLMFVHELQDALKANGLVEVLTDMITEVIPPTPMSIFHFGDMCGLFCANCIIGFNAY